jgi:hypothetical protein
MHSVCASGAYCVWLFHDLSDDADAPVRLEETSSKTSNGKHDENEAHDSPGDGLWKNRSRRTA